MGRPPMKVETLLALGKTDPGLRAPCAKWCRTCAARREREGPLIVNLLRMISCKDWLPILEIYRNSVEQFSQQVESSKNQ